MNKMAKQHPQNLSKITYMSDMTLFVHCVYEKLYDCSKFLISVKPELLQNMVQGEITDKAALLQMILTNKLPEKKHTREYTLSEIGYGDLQLIVGSDVISCHQFVMKKNDRINEMFDEQNLIPNDMVVE